MPKTSLSIEAFQAFSEEMPLERQHLAFQGFLGVMKRWGVEDDVARRLLGSPPQRTYFRWKQAKSVRLPTDTLRRIGHLAGVYKALQVLYSDPVQADTWMKRENDAFEGQTPLQRMAAGDVTDFAAVRAYLDSAHAPWG